MRTGDFGFHSGLRIALSKAAPKNWLLLKMLSHTFRSSMPRIAIIGYGVVGRVLGEVLDVKIRADAVFGSGCVWVRPAPMDLPLYQRFSH